ncbi:hypothetical protein GRS90_15870, partial [Escherichia coli]|nr:hypothetical protein [Escherichia coli]
MGGLVWRSSFFRINSLIIAPPKGDDFMYNCGESYSEYDISLSDDENYDD